MGTTNAEKQEILEDVRAGDMSVEEGRKKLGVNQMTINAWLHNKVAPEDTGPEAGEGEEAAEDRDPRRPPDQVDLVDLVEPEPEPEPEPYDDPIKEYNFDTMRLSAGELRKFDRETGKRELSDGLYTWIFEALERVELRGQTPRVVNIGGGVEGGGNPWYYWRLQGFLADAIAHGRVLSKAEIKPGVSVLKCDALGEYVLVC